MYVSDERNNVLDLRSTTSCSLERWLSFTDDQRDLVGLGAVEMRRVRKRPKRGLGPELYSLVHWRSRVDANQDGRRQRDAAAS